MTTSLARGVLRALRPKQWLKNVLVFAAPVAAGVIKEPEAITKTLLAFVCLCLASSATYLLNDARDVESDRVHPTKRNRPIASGVVSLPLAYALSALLAVVAIAGAFLTARNLGITVVAYVALTTAYTLELKHMVVIDIIAVAAGFVLRAIAGAAATGVPISEWFFIVTSFGALLMVSGKRESEAKQLAGNAASVRPTLGEYTPSFLAFIRAVSTAVVLIAYCLWAFASAGVNGSGAATGPGNTAIWYQLSIVPFAIAILEYALRIDRGDGSEPEQLVLGDRTLQLAGLAWAIIYGYATYYA